jgi:CubicO group peptidase (beta-lactamase class C family)
MIRIVALLVAPVIATASLTARAGVADPGERIRAVIDDAVAQGFSGSVVVAEGDRILVAGTFGSMHGKAIASDGRFLIASAAKQFTSTALLLLQERNLLRIDDPLSRHLPDVPPDKKAITIRQLLSHTSGLAQGYNSETVASWREAAAKILAEPLAAQPGERFIYSNENYALGIAVVEATTGRRYADFAREELLEPHSLRDTGQLDGSASASRLSPLIGPLPPRLVELRWGGHGYYTTGHDLLAWYRALRSGAVLNAASVDALFEPQVKVGEGQSALGWFLGTTASGEPTVFTRGNEDMGANSLLYAYPARDAVIVVLTHAGDKGDEGSWSRYLHARIEAVLTGSAPP